MSLQELEIKKQKHIGLCESVIGLFNTRNIKERCYIVRVRAIMYNLNILKGEQLEAYLSSLNSSVEQLLKQVG